MSTRTVRQLKLRVPSADEARRATQQLEEAFRVASMPGDDRPGVLYVRKLDLGAISLASPASKIAHIISERLRALSISAVPIDSPNSDREEAVRAKDELEPLVALATRAAQGQRKNAWFWPSAVRGYRPSMTVTETMQLILRRTMLSEVGPAAVFHILDVLVERRCEVQLLESLRVQDVQPYLQSFDALIHRPPTASPVGPAPSLRAVSPAWREVLVRWLARWPERDVRSIWLCLAALSGRSSHPAPTAIRVARAVSLKQEVLRTRPPQRLGSATSPAAARHPIPLDDNEPAARTQAMPSATRKRAHATRDTAATPAALEADAGLESDSRASQARRPRRRSRVEWSYTERPQATGNAGLFFVLAILKRLGLPVFVERHPELVELDLARRIIADLAIELEIPPDDPVWLPLELPVTTPAIKRSLERRFEAPASWPERPGGRERNEPVAMWTWAVHWWLQAYTDLTLESVARRPGAVLVTRTHLDVLFDLRQSDLQIRKAGLDIDPGWVPWFGRVVKYHYLVGGVRG